jgi:5'-3' exonuclease
MRKKLFDRTTAIILVDFNNQVWKNHHATERKMSPNADGICVGSILGLMKTLMHAYNRIKELHARPKLVICEDRTPTRKRKLFKKYQHAFKDYKGTQRYKGNRPTKDLGYNPMEICKEFMTCIPHTTIYCEGEEADDVMATYVIDNTNKPIVMYSTDSDMWQLLEQHSKLKIYLGGEGITPHDILQKRFQTDSFRKVVLHKIVKGDHGDNVKGVRNYQFKRSILAYEQCDGTIENYLHKLITIYGEDNRFIQQLLQPHNISLLKLNTKLVKLRTDVDYEREIVSKPNWEKWKHLCFMFETPSLLRVRLLDLF